MHCVLNTFFLLSHLMQCLISNKFGLVVTSSNEKDVIKLKYNKYSTNQKQSKYDYRDASKQPITGMKLEFNENIELNNEESPHRENIYQKLVIGEEFDDLDVTIKSIEEVIVEEMEEFGNISNISCAYQVTLNIFFKVI